LNKTQYEDGWWKKSYTEALENVKTANYVASGNESSSSEEESESEDETSESEKSYDDTSDSGSEYDEEDEQIFKDVAKKYLKK